MVADVERRTCHLPLFRESPRARALRLIRYDAESISSFLALNYPESWKYVDEDIDPREADLDYYTRTLKEAFDEKCEQHGDVASFDCDACATLLNMQERELETALHVAEWLAKMLGAAPSEMFVEGREPLEALTEHECGDWIPLPGRDRISTLAELGFVHRAPPRAAGVYYIFVAGRVKIGQSQNIAKRLAEISTATPEPPVLVTVELGDAAALEELAHRRWEVYRRHREWFACEGELLAWLKKENSRAD